MKTTSVKTDRDDGSFSIISRTECQEAVSEGQCVKQTRDMSEKSYCFYAHERKHKVKMMSGNLLIFFKLRKQVGPNRCSICISNTFVKINEIIIIFI